MKTINLLAPINSLGYGIVGLNVSLALEGAGYEPALWPIGQVEALRLQYPVLQRMTDRTRFYDSIAPSLRIWHQFDLAQHVGRGMRCAMPIFELTKFTEAEIHHLKSQDIIFANSEWAASVLGANGVAANRIEYAPLGVDTTIFHPRRHTVAAGGPTTFLNVGKWELRKGHDFIIKAFNAAFTRTDAVRLVMNCHNPCFADPGQLKRYNHQWEALYRASPLHEKIHVMPHRLANQHELARVMNEADCGVFPSRAEGWNLDLCEMMACGKTVIATNYSAHTEYLTPENALLIDIEKMESAFDGVWFHGQGEWAQLGDRQLEQLVEHMRAVHRQKQDGVLTHNAAGIATMNDFTWDRTAREIASVL